MNRKDIFTKLVIIVFAITILFFLFTKVLILIKNNTYANADKKIEKLLEKKEKLQETEKALGEYKNFGSVYNKIKQERFFKYKDISVFRKMLQQLLSQYNFQSSSYNFSGKEILKEFIRVPLSIKLTGQYKDLKKFIYDINKMKKFININSMKFQKAKSNITGSFSMEVYFVK